METLTQKEIHLMKMMHSWWNGETYTQSLVYRCLVTPKESYQILKYSPMITNLKLRVSIQTKVPSSYAIEFPNFYFVKTIFYFLFFLVCFANI
jgi:hypothetical protein